MGGVPPPPPHLQAPTAADPGRGEGPRERDPQLLPPKASMFTPLSALLRHGDLSGDRAFSKTPLSCPTVCCGLSPPGFLGEEEGKDRMLFGGNSRDFFFFFFSLKGMVKHLIWEADTNPSTVSGLGSGSSGWLACCDISVLQTLVWGP